MKISFLDLILEVFGIGIVFHYLGTAARQEFDRQRYLSSALIL